MLIAFIGCTIFRVIVNRLVDDEINSEVVISSESSTNYDSWRTNKYGDGADAKVHFDLYFFDVQNPEEVIQGDNITSQLHFLLKRLPLGAKPIVVEKGPYAYDEYFEKFDIEFSDGGNIATYNEQTYYVFNQDRSLPGLSENDNLTLVYPTAMGIQYLVETIPVNVTDLVMAKINASLLNLYHYVEYELEEIYEKIDSIRLLPRRIKDQIENDIRTIESDFTIFYQTLWRFLSETTPADILFKLLLCASPYGISPFWQVNPSTAC
jgi:hypothetical protein